MNAWEIKTAIEAEYPGYNASVIDCAYPGWTKSCWTIYLMEKPCTEIAKSKVAIHAYQSLDEALAEVKKEMGYITL